MFKNDKMINNKILYSIISINNKILYSKLKILTIWNVYKN